MAKLMHKDENYTGGGAQIDDTTTSATSVWSSSKTNTELAKKADTSSLATVATTGSYDDLSDTPTIPTALSQLSDDTTHRVVTDTEKTTWNAKAEIDDTTTSASKVWSSNKVNSLIGDVESLLSAL